MTSSDAPDTVLYDQAQDEWVLLLSGEARLEIAGEAISLSSGDYLFIPAYTPHRLLQTSAEPGCTWLAIHLDREA
ncbi:cupin domain-containing protein [Halochromatium sp.]